MTSRFAYTLGCDISKDKLDISLLNKRTCKIEQQYVCQNSIKGFKRIKKGCEGKEVHIAMEATGNYHLRFIDYLSKEELSYSVIHPTVNQALLPDEASKD